MNQKFLTLAQSWDDLNRAISSMLVAQPSKMSAASEVVDAARLKHETLFMDYARSQM